MAEEEVKWYQIQEKVFTRWVNDYLSERDDSLDSLRTDLKDGRKLITLCEILSGKRVGRHNRNPRMKFHKIENLGIVLKFIKKQGLPLVNIGPEDIYNGNMTIILGLIWLLILFYEIKQGDVQNKSQSNLLLQWVKQQIPEYKLKNFTTNWNDGRAICGLVNSFIPGFIPDHYDKDSKNLYENAKLGIEMAEEYLGIDQLILPEEMNHPKVDKLAMMTYISQFRNIKEEDIKIPKGAQDCRAWGDGLNGGVASVESKFYVEVPKDVKPGNLKVQVFLCAEDQKTEVPVNVKKSANEEEYEVTYTPQVAGQYRIQVRVDDKHIPGSAFELNVKSGASLCKAYGPGLEDGGMAGKQKDFIVEVPNTLQDKLEVRVEGPENEAPVELSKNDQGNYDVKYEPKVPGKYRVHVTVGQEHIPNSIFEVEVSHPASACKAYGPGLEKSVIGEDAPFKVEIPEWISEDYKLDVTIQDPAGNNYPVDIVQTAGRNYDCVYQPKTPGDYKVNVRVGEEHVPGSTFKVMAATPVASQCRAYGDGLSKGIAGKSSDFTVEIPDQIKDEVEGKLEVKVEGPEGVIPSTMTKNDKGDFDVQYTPTTPGNYMVHVNVGIHPIPGSVFQPKVQPPADFCNAYGPGLESGITGQEAPFEIEVPKELSELVEGKIAVTIQGPNEEEKNIEVIKNDQGNYDVVYIPNSAGDYKVSCTVNSVHVPNSSFTVPIKHPADFCKAHGEGLEKATSGKPSSFVIEVAEEVRPLVDGKLEVKVEGPNDQAEVKVIQNDNGDYDVNYSPSVPGEYKIYVSVDSQEIPGSCFELTVDHPASFCKAHGEGLNRGVAGREAKFFVDVPEDLQSLVDGKLGITVDGPDGEVSTNAIKNDKGNYEISYLPKVPGEYKVAVTVEENHVPDSVFAPTIEKPDAQSCTAYGGGLEEAQAEVPTSFVVVMPQAIPEEDLKVVIECPDGGKNIVSVTKREEKEKKVNTSKLGAPKNKFDVKYTPKVLESYPQNFLIHVTVNGYDIPNSVFEVPILKPPVRGRVRVYFTTTTASMVTRSNIDKVENLFYILKVHLRPDFEPWVAVDMLERSEREEIFTEAGTRELPIVFIDDVYVGGWDNIQDLNDHGELAPMLALHTVKLLTPEEHYARLFGLADDEDFKSGKRTHFCGTCGWTKLENNSYCPECGSTNPMPFTPAKLAKKLRFHEVKQENEPEEYARSKKRRYRHKTPEEMHREREEKKQQRIARLPKLKKDEVNDTEFFLACYHGDLEKVEAMMRQGINPNTMDEDGVTPWIAALEGGQDGVGVLLIDYGHDFTQEDFFIAVNDDHLDLVEIMLEKGANPNIVDEEGTSPLMLAIENQHGLMARMLRKHGATEKPPPSTKKFLPVAAEPLPTGDDYDQLVLDFFEAAYMGNIEKINSLLARGMKADLVDEDGGTLLQAAQEGEDPDLKSQVIALLKKHGAK